MLNQLSIEARNLFYVRELQRQRCKNFNVTRSLERFENKIFFLYLEKRSAKIQRWRSMYVVLKSVVVGLDPG
jgi:hypothetical protein